ncbi:MAG: STAS domain-containing protein [Brachymonas sp.]|nr:STAS domain-containing protein [Brachymonas sp.]
MAQDKSKFLSKLARFVANPTTDWSALDGGAQAGRKGKALSGEGLQLTQAEILAMRHQRRKDNRNIRIQEFAMLRQVRAGASAPNAHSMVSAHSRQSASAESAEAAKVAAVQKPTLIANFSDKIDRIEQQMAEQWWDSVDKTKPLHTQIPIQREVPKTQMLIETQAVQFDMPDALQNSDVIAFDPSMLEGLPVQPVAQPAATPSVEPAPAPVVAPPPQQTQPASPMQPPVQRVAPAAPAPSPLPAQTAQAAQAARGGAPAPSPVAPHGRPPTPAGSPAALAAMAPAGPVAGASPAPLSAAPAAPPQPLAAVVPAPVPASLSPDATVAAQPTASAAAAPLRRGGYAPASPMQGIGEQVDFSADQPAARSESTFVYRDAFTEFPPEETHGALTSGGLSAAEGELPLHPLAEADSRSMVEAQAELYGEQALQPRIVVPPEYTPADLPECLNEPAILFVQGQLEQAEAQLQELAQAEQLRARMGQGQTQEPHVLLALLDFYRSTEQEEKFEAASIEMVRHFDRSAPQYQGADLGEATRILSTLGSFADIDYSVQNGWRCPAELDLTDVMLLRAQLMTQPPQVLLDWQMLQTIQDDAVEPLLDQFRDLAGRKVDLLMWGSEQLMACCLRAIEAQNGVASPLLSLLWLLRLELVRIMHGQEAFDRVALDYCVALEESPPSWVRTRCHFIDADNALSMLDGKQADSALAHGGADLSKDEEATLKHPLQWKGTFQGNIQALLQAVSTACQGDFCVIDCSQFNGMDYPAAVALLEWLMEPQNAQRRIQFVQVNRLLAVFWRVMGITAQATVRLRRD